MLFCPSTLPVLMLCTTLPLPPRAQKDLTEHTLVTDIWEEFCTALDKKMLIMAPFCGDIPCEDLIKKNSARYVDALWGPH